MPHSIIALGSNRGDRRAHLYRAVDEITHTAGDIQVIAPIVQTAPVNMTSTAYFLNTALILDTKYSPKDLLDRLQAIELRMGQDPNKNQADRIIDLDIIAYEDQCIQEPGLQIPHPRYHTRLFVLAPLYAIMPDWRDPSLGETIASLYTKAVSRETAPVTLSW